LVGRETGRGETELTGEEQRWDRLELFGSEEGVDSGRERLC
jgi:hypothetical protein